MEDVVRWTLRLPRRVRDNVRQWAERDHRSLNGQIVAMLEEALARRERGQRQEERGDG